MQEYTVEEIVEIAEGLPVLKIGAGGFATDDIPAVADAYEGVLELVERIPRKARYGALACAGIAMPAEDGTALYLPVANNCALGAGVRISQSGDADFAVGPVAPRDGDALVTHFAARGAIAHALSGRADLSASAAIPDPAENGAANTRRAAAPRTVAAPDACGRAPSDGLPEEREEEELAHPAEDPRAEQVPSTLEVEGLADPMIARRFGVGGDASVADGSTEGIAKLTPEAVPDPRTIRPDWRERVSALLITDPVVRAEDGGRLRADASGLAAASHADPALNDPACFASELRDLGLRRAKDRLTGEDLRHLGRIERHGAVAPSSVPEVAVDRLADAGEATLASVGGEVLILPAGGFATDDPRAIAVAARARGERLADADARRREVARERRRRVHLLDALAGWQKAEARDRLSESLAATVHHEMVALDAALVVEALAPFSPVFIARLGRHAKASIQGGRGGDVETVAVLLAAYRDAYRVSSARQRDLGRDRRPAKLHPGPGPFSDPMANRGDVAKAYRRGLRGKAARLKDLGAPPEEVRFWRCFELKANGDPRGAYATPEVPFGGTLVRCDALGFELRVEAEKVRHREKAPVGLLAKRITERPPVHARYGPAEAGNVVHVRALTTWTERAAVVFDPEGLYEAPEPAADKDRRLTALLAAVADGRVRTAAEARKLARRLRRRGVGVPEPSWADRLPDSERESGPEPEGTYARRGRDPYAAERGGAGGQEAVVHTATGRTLLPSARPRERERARRRVARVVERARTDAQAMAGASAEATSAGRIPEHLSSHLRSLPVAERLELFLALRGPVELSVLKEKSEDPGAVMLAAAALRRAGKVTIEGGRISAPPLTTGARRELEERLAKAPSAHAA